MLLFDAAYAADEVCSRWGDVETITFGADMAPIENPVPQVSGLVPGPTPGTYYGMGDAGTENELTIFSTDGETFWTQTVNGATNTDWEDLSEGACPDAVDADRCVFIGDIGDNASSRDHITIWVVPVTDAQAVEAVACPLRYEDLHPRDAEAMFVSTDGVVRIVTKATEAKVFRVPTLTCDGVPQILVKEAELNLSEPPTGAAVSPDGSQVILRSEHHAWLWEGCLIDWSATPIDVPIAEDEPKGEAISLEADGTIVTSTEQKEGSTGPPLPFVLHILPCVEMHTAVEACGCACAVDVTTGSAGRRWGASAIVLAMMMAGVRRRR